MKTPLYTALQTYIDKNYARFHIPGHKGSAIFDGLNLLPFDVTEVLGTDSLYESSDAILQTEQCYANLYGTVKSCISAGGSSLCIQSMLALVARKNAALICGRIIHSSAVYAMALLDITPIWVSPEESENLGIGGRMLAADIEQAILKNPNALGVYLTSPDYFGVLSDIKSIASVCKTYGIPLLVDNAHGAHLHFLQPSLHPMHLGATMCCDSLHKTLPVLTGGAMLHINDSYFANNAKSKMALFASTSPNYLIMLSIDVALNYIKNDLSKDLTVLCEKVASILKLAHKKGFSILSGEKDPTRISLGFAKIGYTKQTFETHLRKHHIEPEYVSHHFCVLIPSGYTTTKDFNAVIGMLEDTTPQPSLCAPSSSIPKPIIAMPMKEAIFSPSIEIDIENACDAIASTMVNPCPPGVPLLMPGEKITPYMLQLLKNYGIKKIFVVE